MSSGSLEFEVKLADKHLLSAAVDWPCALRMGEETLTFVITFLLTNNNVPIEVQMSSVLLIVSWSHECGVH